MGFQCYEPELTPQSKKPSKTAWEPPSWARRGHRRAVSSDDSLGYEARGQRSPNPSSRNEARLRNSQAEERMRVALRPAAPECEGRDVPRSTPGPNLRAPLATAESQGTLGAPAGTRCPIRPAKGHVSLAGRKRRCCLARDPLVCVWGEGTASPETERG